MERVATLLSLTIVSMSVRQRPISGQKGSTFTNSQMSNNVNNSFSYLPRNTSVRRVQNRHTSRHITNPNTICKKRIDNQVIALSVLTTRMTTIFSLNSSSTTHTTFRGVHNLVLRHFSLDFSSYRFILIQRRGININSSKIKRVIA